MPAGTSTQTDMFFLSQSSVFKNRVQSSLITTCTNISSEGISATMPLILHIARKNFVSIILTPSQFQSWLTQFVGAASVNQTLIDAATQAATNYTPITTSGQGDTVSAQSGNITDTMIAMRCRPRQLFYCGRLMRAWQTLLIGVGILVMPPPAAAQQACNMVLGGTPIFCNQFDKPNPNPTLGRTGVLDPNVWGVSRENSLTGFGQGNYNTWAATKIVQCNGVLSSTAMMAPKDLLICPGGVLHEAMNDNDAVAVVAMYPKQPIDFSGRTATISFEVSNDSGGSHAAWPELWVTDKPVPAPFEHFFSYVSLPQHGFGLRFHGFVDANNNGNSCPEGSPGNIGLGSAITVNNYVANDWDNGGAIIIKGDDCVKQPTAFGQLNHFEVRFSQNQIDVWGTDAGVSPSAATLRHLATVTNLNLDPSFNSGIVWFIDAHYAANKFGNQQTHTFVWRNPAFDGPFKFRDFAYDAPDAVPPGFTGALANLGKVAQPNALTLWTTVSMPANPTPEAVRVLFNFFAENLPTSLSAVVNGNVHTFAWPYPDQTGNSWRTYALTIPVTDLVAGANTVQIGATDQPIIVANVDIVLSNVPGGVPILPGSNNGYPTTPPVPPTVPSNIVATPASPTSVNLTWSASSGNPAGYNISRNGSQVGTSTAPSFTDTGLTGNTQYTYTVSAFNSAGNSGQSAPVVVTTPPLVCTVTFGQPGQLTGTPAANFVTSAVACQTPAVDGGCPTTSSALTFQLPQGQTAFVTMYAQVDCH